MPNAIFVVVVALLVAAVGAIIDARTGHIPNRLTLTSLAAAPVVWFGVGARSGDLHEGASLAILSVVGGLLCGLGPLIAFLRGGIGGGDVKLLAALGALLGPRHGMNAELASFCLGALYVPAALAWRGHLFATLAGALAAAANPLRSKEARRPLPEALKERVRLGPAIFGGTLLAAVLMQVGS